MGTWGTGILENDTTNDIWSEFKDLYNQGLEPNEIRIHLENEYLSEIDNEEYSEIWTGIAYGQWMFGKLEKYTLDKVAECLRNTNLLTLWLDDEKLLKKRIVELEKFIEKIKNPNDKPQKRKKITSHPAYFKKGDILSIKLNENLYTSGLVIDDTGEDKSGANTIIFSESISQHIPSINEHLKSNVMYLDLGGENYYYQGFFWGAFSAKEMKKNIDIAKVIGQVHFTDYTGLSIGLAIGDWNAINDLYIEQLDFLRTNTSRSPFKINFQTIIEGKNEKLQNELYEHSKFLIKLKLNK